MLRRTWIGVAVVVASALSVALATQVRARVAEANVAPASTSLTALDADAQAWLGRTVKLTIQVDAELDRWNPYLTRFGSVEYRSWRAWGDEQFLWRKSDWESPHESLFARRGGAAEKALAGAPRYARFELTGRVRQVFLGRAWIEIDRAERLQSEVDEASLVHASRGVLLMENERWVLAVEDFDRALAGDLPQHAREELMDLRKQCAERAKR